MSSLLKNLITALCITIIIGVGVYVWSGMNDDLSGDIPIPASSDVTYRTEKILADTQEIESLQFNNTIYVDKRFKDLTDFSVQITDVPAGRENPFAPVE